jgi:5-methylcytosine-specific restriction enzyme A
MTTYLLSWNPKKWEWENMQDDIAEIAQKGFFEMRWSSGVTKKIKPNDRVFLMKLGVEPRGVVASGRATSGYQQNTHFSDKSKKALYIGVRFDTILDPISVFPIEILLHEKLYAGVHWTPQASGMSIPDNVAKQLEKDWKKFINRPTLSNHFEYADETESKNSPPLKVLTEIYRILRDTALARKIKEKHNFVCQVCDLAPIQLPNGNFYAEAHHLMPLGKHGGLDIEGNIICVCPNCHAKLDYGVIKLKIGKLQAHKMHRVEERFVKYHNKEIYNKMSFK